MPHILSSSAAKEAEEAIRARLQAAEQELMEKPLAQEKLKGFIAAWLSAMKVIPRTAPGTEALLSQQDDDRRGIMQKQSQLEVELFWSSIEHGGGCPAVHQAVKSM
jgi:hypothetical protein